MATFESPGLEKYIKKLDELSMLDTARVVGPAIYDAAAIVADETRAQLEAIPVDGGMGSVEKPLKGPNQKQKDALLASLGVSPLSNDDGYYNVKIGFAGYNDIKTARWPNGQPNPMIARAVIRGTTFLQANNFIKRAVAAAKDRATKAMEKRLDKELDHFWNDI